jgi:hypothetical protein
MSDLKVELTELWHSTKSADASECDRVCTALPLNTVTSCRQVPSSTSRQNL